MMHDTKCCFGLSNLQKSWSMRDALYFEGRIGSVIFRKKHRVTNKSKYFWISTLSFICRRSILKSSVIIEQLFSWAMLLITGSISDMNFRRVTWLLFDLGGLYIFPTVILPFKFSPININKLPIPQFRFHLNILDGIKKIIRKIDD